MLRKDSGFTIPAMLPPVCLIRSIEVLEGDIDTTVFGLCESAEIKCRVTGKSAMRRVVVRKIDGQEFGLSKTAGDPGAILIESYNTDPLFVLGLLAYGINDYAARESVCGKVKYGVC